MDNKKEIAVKLRSTGLSIDEISSNIGVHRSTVYGWVRRLKLNRDAKNNLHQNKQRKLGIARQKSIATYELRRQNAQFEARTLANRILALVKHSKSSDILLLSVMYWCEGGKDTRYGLHFINSDPVMIALFMKKLRLCFQIDESRLKIMLHLHSYHNKIEVISYWAKICGVSEKSFFNPYIKPNTATRIKAGYMGCVSIRYTDKKLADLLTMVYTEYAHSAII